VIIDSFAGGGGASLGIEMALGRSPDIAINHDDTALAMHVVNHPETAHLCENVWKVDLSEHNRGQKVNLLWASPDCRDFSKAKGGKPTSKSVRMLAWCLVRFVRDLKRNKPEVICLENVEEFQLWEDFASWKKELRRLGYKIDARELRACDYGAPTIRKRLIIVMRSDGRPIVWPKPTHGDPKSPAVLSGKLKPWPRFGDYIDWTQPCPSIFDTAEEIKEKFGVRAKRPLADNTLRRVAKGIVKYTLEAADPFLATVGYGEREGQSPRVRGVDEPLSTVTASGVKSSLVAPIITAAQHGGSVRSANDPIHTIAASRKDQNSIIVPHISRQFGQSIGSSLADPIGTTTANGGGKSALVAGFLAQHNSERTGHNPGRSAHDPAATILGRGTQTQLVSSNLVSLKGNDRRDSSLQGPHPTVLAGGLHSAEIRAFLIKYYGTAVGQSLKEPAHSVTTKERFGLVTLHINGEPYYIADIGMRMLTPRELFRAQGFPDSYIIDRGPDGRVLTKTESIHKCGNSVCPPLAKAVVEANCEYLIQRKNAA